MKLLEGVLLYELVLMVLGLAMGIALIYLLIKSASKKEGLDWKLLMGFMMPITMIGYPSIKQIQFKDGIVTIDKTVKEVEKNPLDTAAQKKLITQMGDLSNSRTNESPGALTSLAKAQLALGQYDTAHATVVKALEMDKTNSSALEAKKDIEEKQEHKRKFDDNTRRLEHHLEDWKNKPKDHKRIKDSINLVLRQIPTDDVRAENKDILTVATAAAIAGHKEVSTNIVNDVLKVTPNSVEAKELKKRIDGGDFVQEQPIVLTSVLMPAPADMRPGKIKRPTPAPVKVERPVEIPNHPSDTLMNFRLTPKGKWKEEEH
jgi:tetratricopeptide (TPR) repeat protein